MMEYIKISSAVVPGSILFIINIFALSPKPTNNEKIQMYATEKCQVSFKSFVKQMSAEDACFHIYVI